MAAIVYAVPYIPVITPLDRVPFVSKWTGWDESVWEMSDPSDGVFLMPGVRGLDSGPHDRFSDQAPALAGSLFNGLRATERPVFWPVALFEDNSSAGWVARDAAFHRTLRPGKVGTWAVTDPSGSTRTLTCRFVSKGEGTFDYDPAQAGWAAYQVYLVADEDPFWRGAPVQQSWTSTESVDFFDPDGSPLFHISSGATVDTAELTNPGDVDAWPVWVVDGPVTSVDLGVGSTVIEVPFAVADGKRLVIDSNPTEQVAHLGDADPSDPIGVLSPTDVTDNLGAVDFTEIPADATTELSIVMVGTGTVTARIVPGYWRAW